MLLSCHSFLDGLFRCDFGQIDYWLLLMYVVRLSLFGVIRVAVNNSKWCLIITALDIASQGYIVLRNRNLVRWIRSLSLHRRSCRQLTRPLDVILWRWIKLLLVHQGGRFVPIYICHGHLIHKAAAIVVYRAVTDLWQTILVRSGADRASTSSGIFVIKQFMTCGVSDIVIRYFVTCRRMWHMLRLRLLLTFPVCLIHSLVCKHARVFCRRQVTRDKLIHFRCLICQRHLRTLWNLSLFSLIQRLLLFLSTVLVLLLSFAEMKLLWSTVAVHCSQVLIRRPHHSPIDCRHHHSFGIVRHSDLIELFSLGFCGTARMVSLGKRIFLSLLLSLTSSLVGALGWLGIEGFIGWWREI